MLRLLRLDALQLMRDRLAITVLVIGSVACLLSVVVGQAWMARLSQDASSVALTALSERDAARKQWVTAGAQAPEEAVLAPGRTRLSLPLRPPLLPDFTAGRSAIEPSAANIRLSTQPDTMFARYQVENPERLARGGFDLSLVSVVFAPILLIGLGYGVFVGDRDAGTARLWLAQAGSPFRLLIVRSLNRLTLIALPIVAASLALLALGPDMAGRGAAAALWLSVALLSLLFWWAVILLVNSFKVSAETAALVLMAIWAALVFVVPVATASAAILLNPPPSRFEQIAAARSVEIRASRDFDDDHPDLSSSTLEGRRASVTKGVEVRGSVAAAVEPLVRAYDGQIAAQQAVLRRLAVLSPPAMIAEVLAGIARTDFFAYAAQRRAAVEYLTPFGGTLSAAALGQRPINAATFDAIPPFVPAPAPPMRLAFAALTLIITLVVIGLALARFRRVQPL